MEFNNLCRQGKDTKRRFEMERIKRIFPKGFFDNWRIIIINLITINKIKNKYFIKKDNDDAYVSHLKG